VYVSPELLEKIKRIDLLTYLKNYEPQELVHFSGNTYTTRTNDSLKISNGMWNWFSRGIGGKSALDYLIKVRGMSFLDAVEIIRNNLNLIDNFIYHEPIKQKEKKLILPQKSKTNDKVIRYLKSRGIDQAIIQECINNAVKHSNGNLIEIKVKNNNDCFDIIISDNGEGFDVNEIFTEKAKRHFGLMILEERVNILHGTINIDSVIEKGTRVHVQLPLMYMDNKE